MFGAIFGILLIFIGFVFFFFPPKKRNGIYGYRTSRSMKSEEAFTFANKLFSEYFLAVSFGTLILSVIGNLYFSQTAADFTSLIGFFIFLILLVLFIESELKSHFDDQGNAISE